MSNLENSFNFLRRFVAELFDHSGFETLSEESRKQFLPLFEIEVKRRLATELLPKLNEEQAQKLITLIDDAGTTGEQMEKFWEENIPDFEAVVAKVLADYTEEFKGYIAKQI